MAVVGTLTNRDNPEYNLSTFLFWFPEFATVTDIETYFNQLYPIANQKIFYSIFGVDWFQAMGLCIAHYCYIIGQRLKYVARAATSLSDIAGGSPSAHGILSSAGVGGFSKTYDLDRSMISGEDKIWWNQSEYGKQLMNLLASKPWPTILVVTNNPIPGS